QLGPLTAQQVEHHPGAEPGRGHPQPGVAERVRDAAAVRGAEERAEPAARIDRTAPAMAEPDAFQLRKRAEEVPGERGEGSRALIVGPADVAAEVVDGVVAAPQDPVVGGQPVVMELVTRVADALPVLPAD